MSDECCCPPEAGSAVCDLPAQNVQRQRRATKDCPVCGMKLQLSKKEQMKADITKNYSCPMHLDVTSDKAGKCPQCGMNLTLSPKEKMKAEVMGLYSCPMHPDQTCDKPCKCSKCGMDMEEKKVDKSDNQR